MSDIEIVNPLSVDEAKSWLTSMATTFLDDPHSDDFERHLEAWRRDWHPTRVWGARADGRWIATLATDQRNVTVPGMGEGTNLLGVDALTAVSVSATHRRRGVLTRMLSESLRQARERNDALSILVAAEWPIYGRFGYAPATHAASYTYFPRTAAVAPADIGSVRQIEPVELASTAPELFERARRGRAGQVDRGHEWWPRRLGLDGYRPLAPGKPPSFYVSDGPDGIDGLLWWAPERAYDLNGDLGALGVGDLITTSDDGYRNLWAYLSGIDLVGEIHLRRRPVDEPVRWLLADGRALRQTYTGDDLWIRILDVPATLAARSYSSDGHLVLEVVDRDTGGFAGGRYLLEAEEGESSCRPTRQSADIQLSQRTLASIYLGGVSLRQLAITGLVTELSTSAIRRADAMFATQLPPWNATMF